MQRGGATAGRSSAAAGQSAPANRKHLLLAAFLAVLTLLVYLPVLENGFVDLDDHLYLDANPRVRIGFTPSSVAWAFTTFTGGSWHPLTWLSHLADIELFGLDPRGHHLTSAAIHAASVGLLFLLVRAMTGAFWPSAAAAALFGLHPLRVESVAWAAERKDVLAALFWILTTGAYLRFVRRPGTGAFLGVCCLLLLGLMAKPMLVTLPCTLLLLDWWPLGRLRADFWRRRPSPAPGRFRPGRLLLEKAPLFALAAASSATTLFTQHLAGAIRPAELYPLSLRLANALVSYPRYLGKTLWPSGLAVLYPHPLAGLPTGTLAAALALLAAATAAVVRHWRKPYLACGWIWFLGTLVPVLGIVQIGAAASADRYTYVPHIGLFILIAWGLRDLGSRSAVARRLLPGAAAAALAACACLTWLQIGVWRDSVSLFGHAVAVTEENWMAHLDLALSLNKAGRGAEARAEYREVVRLKPGYGPRHQEFGVTRGVGGTLERALAGGEETAASGAKAAVRRGEEAIDRGHLEEGIAAYEEAVRLDPGFSAARYGLANALSRAERIPEAIAAYERLLEADPRHWAGHNNLGIALLVSGRAGEAKAHFLESLRLFPRNAAARSNLGLILIDEGRPAEALGHLEAALHLKPDDTRAMASYAEALLRLGRTAEAEAWCRETLRLAPGNRRARELLREAEERRP